MHTLWYHTEVNVFENWSCFSNYLMEFIVSFQCGSKARARKRCKRPRIWKKKTKKKQIMCECRHFFRSLFGCIRSALSAHIHCCKASVRFNGLHSSFIGGFVCNDAHKCSCLCLASFFLFLFFLNNSIPKHTNKTKPNHMHSKPHAHYEYTRTRQVYARVLSITSAWATRFKPNQWNSGTLLHTEYNHCHFASHNINYSRT